MREVYICTISSPGMQNVVLLFTDVPTINEVLETLDKGLTPPNRKEDWLEAKIIVEQFKKVPLHVWVSLENLSAVWSIHLLPIWEVSLERN